MKTPTTAGPRPAAREAAMDSGFLSQTMSSFTFSSDAAVNTVVDAQECRATNILAGDVPPSDFCLSFP